MKKLLLLIFAVSFHSQGATELIGSEMKLHGKVIKPPCEINGGKPIDINFGIVNADKVDGQNYRQSFLLTYDCHGVVMDKILKYIGNVTSFDKTAVESNIANFGIALQLSGEGSSQPFNVNSVMKIPASERQSRLVATPVKNGGSILKAGDFSATATLEVGYP